jgi:hypothetical protein
MQTATATPHFCAELCIGGKGVSLRDGVLSGITFVYLFCETV